MVNFLYMYIYIYRGIYMVLNYFLSSVDVIVNLLLL